jgi:ParB family chromosome partitioning protein
MARKNALGRGLGALIDDADREKLDQIGTVNEIKIDYIELNPFQPRSRIDENGLLELAASIKELGIIQPVTVRKLGINKFQLIIGERRFRAATIAGLQTIPAYIRIADDQAMLELALVENIQREDLNAIEVAISYQRLIEECDLTQENLSERIGKNRSTIANYLRLLKLPAEIQLGIRDGRITMGHARTLVNIEDTKAQINIYYQIIENELSVRRVEELVRGLNTKQDNSYNKSERKKQLNAEYAQLQSRLAKFFETNVQFRVNEKGQGKIVISFKSGEELERILGFLDKLNV